MDDPHRSLQQFDSTEMLSSSPEYASPLILFCLCGILLSHSVSVAQSQRSSGRPSIRPDLLQHAWSAQWIGPSGADGQSYGVYHFRRSLTLEENVDSFVVHTSADNRYQLFVNGTRVRVGPARGEIAHWRFETTDLAPYLEPGENVIAAVVWNFGDHRPRAQISLETGFLLQGNSRQSERVNTDSEWKVTENEAYEPIPRSRWDIDGYLVVGAGERVDGSTYPWGWTERAFNDNSWATANELRPGMPKAGPRGTGIYEGWKLVPRSIPRMERTQQRFSEIERRRGVGPTDGLLEGTTSLVVPPDTTATILLDQNELTTAYPMFTVSGGAGAHVQITYAEALYDKTGRKGNRDRVEDKSIRGYYDVFEPGGGSDRTFRPLWWRTFRYVQLDIETSEKPLRLDDLRSTYTAYPFEETASFSSDNAALDSIWTVGWRTARVCANETYVDTPYWEQLQYVGDTRLQALISLYVDGDDRLMRKAIRAYEHSRVSEGLTESRYPSHEQQFIPTYSLLWISMIHDYWMHRDDPSFVRSFLTSIRGIVDWYKPYVTESGVLGAGPWWNFVDWSFDGGVPPGGERGRSTILSLQLVYALDHAADLASAFNRSDDAQEYRRLSDSLKAGVRTAAWDDERGLLADTPEQQSFSQHANVLGVLTGLFSDAEEQAVMDRVRTDTTLTQATYYFQFYVHRALDEVGLGRRYISQLDPWRTMLDRGLTTFAEEPDPTRSDSHAWSAHPNYNLLAIVAGIRPASPGFQTVQVTPSLGPLDELKASMPHPQGTIAVDLTRQGGGLTGTVSVPADISGTFTWNGTSIRLTGGEQPIDVPSDTPE